MTHLSVPEWGRIDIVESSDQRGFTRGQANALMAAARAHPIANREATNILIDHHRYLRVQQVVGVLAAKGCSLEILPKVDPEAPDDTGPSVRSRLVHMLDVVLGFGISVGGGVALARQTSSLLDMLIRMFADRLLAETRRGLPRRYVGLEEDLPTLRGRLDVVRQFTVFAIRPDRLACRFDTLSADTALLQVMKACVSFLSPYARQGETRRRLDELRTVMSDIADVPRSRLPWDQVQIDRTNGRWASLFALAGLFLKREWQGTHHKAAQDEAISLLFPMNDLFEAYVVAQLRRAMAGQDVQVVSQGGFSHCLGEWREGLDCRGTVFRTRPDIILRHNGKAVAIVDTKWKRLSSDPLEAKHGLEQGDVYQMMAYARLYHCDRLVLLFPATPGGQIGIRKNFGIAGGSERLTLAEIDTSESSDRVLYGLRDLITKVHSGS